MTRIGLNLGCTPPRAATAVAAIAIATGADANAIVQAAAPGATFQFGTGVHRLQSITPKNDQVFTAAAGAVLNGSKLLTGWVADGADWYVTGQTQEGARLQVANGEPGFVRACFPDVVFKNNVPMVATDSRAGLAANRYFFDYTADRIYIRDNPSGLTLEAATTPNAFNGSASGVRLTGLTIEKYASPIQHGAIGGPGNPLGWIISGCTIQLNFGVGVRLGAGSQLLNSFILDNGEMGVGGEGDDIVVQGNEIARNCLFSGIDVLWEGGGAKLAVTNRLLVRSNYCHHNKGFGFWTDIDNINTLYELNRFEYNTYGGLSHEISFACTIRNNTFLDNGNDFRTWGWGGAIQIQNSQDTLVENNTIELTATCDGNGVFMVQQNRGSSTLYGRVYNVRNNTVRNNTMTFRKVDRGHTGAIADFDAAGMTSGGNTINNNSYFVVDINNDHFFWGGGGAEQRTFSAHKTASGQDLNSTLTAL